MKIRLLRNHRQRGSGMSLTPQPVDQNENELVATDECEIIIPQEFWTEEILITLSQLHGGHMHTSGDSTSPLIIPKGTEITRIYSGALRGMTRLVTAEDIYVPVLDPSAYMDLLMTGGTTSPKDVHEKIQRMAKNDQS